MSAKNELITPVNLPAYSPKITYADAITMVGSCFAEHISSKLDRYKYKVLSNPFGILFNPVSIANSFERIANAAYYEEHELILHDGLYHSMDHHGSFSGKNKESVLELINAGIKQARQHIAESKFVFVSLGSAKVYRYHLTGQIVGNCHKIPQNSFDAFRLSVNECESALETITECIKRISPSAQIIWTVSPVRHLRDGIEENQRSKSTLLLAVDLQLKKLPFGGYFPAYEIMMDQLRDYRYYARDMTHPSPLAIDIIWSMFADIYLDPHEIEMHHDIEQVHRTMEHRFIHEDKEGMKSFALKQIKKIEHLESLNPSQDWKEERQYFNKLME